jgi:5-methylthioadenosine/S-adenosylhomocysteine deaminase
VRHAIRAAYVLGYDGRGHVLIPDGEVIFDGDTIIHVGPRTEDPVGWEHDCGRALLLPGFVDLNALGDIDHTVLELDLPAASTAGLTWSADYVAQGPADVLTFDETCLGAKWALVQLIRNGITTALPVTSLLARAWAESFAEFVDIASIAADLGLRTYLGPSFRSAVHVLRDNGTSALVEDEDRGRAGLREAIRFIEHIDGSHGGLIRGLLVPSTIETCSPQLIRDAAEAARGLGLPMRLHCCQSAREMRVLHDRHRCTSIEHLARLGALGAQALLPHAIEVGGPDGNPEKMRGDLDLLVESGSTIVHCPLVMARHGRALQSFGRLWRREASIGLGTDTAPPDMIANLQIGLFTARLVDRLEPPVSAAEYLCAATLGGARALGRSDLGRLAPGAKADIIAVDLSDAHHAPIHDPVRSLFLSASGQNVRHVWIAGRQVMRDRMIPGVDVAALESSARAIFGKIRAAYSRRDIRHRSADELFPLSYALRPTAAVAPMPEAYN